MVVTPSQLRSSRVRPCDSVNFIRAVVNTSISMGGLVVGFVLGCCCSGRLLESL